MYRQQDALRRSRVALLDEVAEPALQLVRAVVVRRLGERRPRATGRPRRASSRLREAVHEEQVVIRAVHVVPHVRGDSEDRDT